MYKHNLVGVAAPRHIEVVVLNRAAGRAIHSPAVCFQGLPPDSELTDINLIAQCATKRSIAQDLHLSPAR